MKRKLTKAQKHQAKAAKVGKQRSAAVEAQKLAETQAEADAVLATKIKAKAEAAAVKKMTPAQRKKAEIEAKKTEKTEAKKLKAILDGPRVFLDNNRHAYLLVEARRSENRYLVMKDGQVEVIGIGRDSRDMTFLKEYEYDLAKAAQKFMDCFLPKTPEATVELCKILGRPVPEVPEEVKAARRARGQRLQAARVPREGYTIQQLCEKLKIAPQVARKALRKAKIEKPHAGWCWPTEKEADAIARHIGLTK